MIRLLILIGLIFAFALGFAWLADLPGDISIIWLDEQIDINPSIAAAVLLIAIVLLMVVFSILRTIVKSPDSIRRFFGRRRRDKGYDALSSALIALGSGDSVAAKRFARDARKQLQGAPVTQFLEAQVAQQEDRADDARAIYQNLTLDERTKLLGLHGLFLEARQQGEAEVAKHYAEQAVESAPHLPWAGQALFELQCAEQDWDAALKTLDRNLHAKLVDRKHGRRLRAVLLTARAIELEDPDPDQARKLALEAHGLAPDLVPASVLAGRLLSRAGDVRKATKVLEATWKKQTHPDIADSYAYVRLGDSVKDRMKRIDSLARMRANHPEGAMALAKVAIDAQEWDMARDALKQVFRSNPTQQAYLLMSELEEAEHGDRGRVREWLARAVHAPRDPAWTADGVISEEWAPISPVTGQLDAFEWKVPVADLGDHPSALIEEAMLDTLPPPVPIPEPEPVVAPIPEAVVEIEAAVVDEADVIEIEPAPEEKPVSDDAAGAEQDTKDAGDQPASASQEKASSEGPAPGSGTESSTETGPESNTEQGDAETAPEAAKTADAEDDKVKSNGLDPLPEDFPLKSRPDDPGPKPKADAGEKKRFSLFS